MAYSMNWRPQLDEIEKTTSSSDPSPASLPPAPARNPVATSTKSASNGAYSYNVNWRPPSSVEAVPEQAISSLNAPSQGGSNASTTLFRPSSADCCPTVHCFGTSAFSCSQDGLVATLEQDQMDGTWDLSTHPNGIELSASQILDLAKAIYACLYAALYFSRSKALQLPHRYPASPSLIEAYTLLALPTTTSDNTLDASFILQNFAFADQHFWRPPRPMPPASKLIARQTFQRRSPPPILVYTRRSGICQAEINITAAGSGAEGFEGEISVGASKLSFEAYPSDSDQASIAREVTFNRANLQSETHAGAMLVSLFHFLLLDEPRIQLFYCQVKDEIILAALMKIGSQEIEQREAAGPGSGTASRSANLAVKDFWNSVTQL